MLVCPACRAEYREGFTRCSACNVALVTPEQVEAEARKHASPKEALADRKKLLIPQPSLAACRELEGALLSAGFDCYTHVQEADADVAFGSAAALAYAVVIAEEEIDEVRDAMKDRFQAMIEKEGFGQLQTDAIDLEAGDVSCPACGHTGALKDGECAECGLFLGAPE